MDFEMAARLSQPQQPAYRFAEERPFGLDEEVNRVHFDQAGGAELDDNDE